MGEVPKPRKHVAAGPNFDRRDGRGPLKLQYLRVVQHPQGMAPKKDFLTLRVQVASHHILTQHLYYNDYYPEPKYLIIGYLDPLGFKVDQR